MKRILIIEDESHLRLLYQKELTEAGYSVLLAGNADAALATLDRQSVDLIILDIRLGNKNGLQVLNEIMARNKNQHVIINTAYSSYMDEGSSWLADAYVVKSSDLSELKATITQVLAPT